MNLVELHKQMIAAARANPPSDAVPYAFEKRVLARLRSSSPEDVWVGWAGALWRATTPCLAVMLLFCAWSLVAPDLKVPNGSNTVVDLSQDLDNTVLAAANPEQLADSTW